VRLLHAVLATVSNDERDHGLKDYRVKTRLFSSFERESTALKDTVIDDLHTYEHARRAVAVEIMLEEELGVLVADTLLRCAALDSKLSDKLRAALASSRSAESPEQLAHVALSCRRFLESLADALEPATAQPRGGRGMGKPQFRNRLWAWLEDHCVRFGYTTTLAVTAPGRAGFPRGGDASQDMGLGASDRPRQAQVLTIRSGRSTAL